jgi:hypothetical protein
MESVKGIQLARERVGGHIAVKLHDPRYHEPLRFGSSTETNSVAIYSTLCEALYRSRSSTLAPARAVLPFSARATARCGPSCG